MDATLTPTVLATAVRSAAALIFVISALHKFRVGAEFEGVVAAYRLLPSSLVVPAARVLPWLELTAALVLLWPTTAIAAVAPALLLLLPMTAAVVINLRRGRTWIDCGCGGTRGQGLSAGLVYRNAVMMLMLLAAARPVSLSALGAGGVLLGLAAGGAFAGLFYSSSQLLANARQWRLIAGGHQA